MPPISAAPPSLSPVRYTSSVEKLDEGEFETTQGLIDTITRIQKTVHEDEGHAKRGVHAKSHGVLVGQLTVLGNLPEELAQGMFARPASYPVILRLSTIPGDVLDDEISVPRGLALKVVGVSGERVAGSENDVTQDFVFANGPSFAKSHPKAFLRTLKLLASTTDKAPGLKKALSSVMRGTEKLVESVGGKSPTLMTLGGYPETHILGDDFFTQAPILYGAYMAKVALKPASAALRGLRNAPLDLKNKPHGIRDAVVDFFRRNAGEWDLQAQLCTDLEAMPIEDAATPWPEDKSPYRTVARIVIPSQDAWDAKRVIQVDEKMSFSPWHALAAHRPLGAIMRVRKSVYEAAARFRAETNQVAITEPKTIEDLPRVESPVA
jgi:hypothetical protein